MAELSADLSAVSPPRALLLTDVVDSVRVSAGLEAEQELALWRTHHRLARDLLRSWRGREIDSSDGFLLLFDEPADALGFARAYHQALSGLTPPLRARAGLHVGTFQTRDNDVADITLGAKAVEVEGIAKVLAARAMAIAHGGQTLMTAAAAEGLAGRVSTESRGHWRVKGIDEPIELFEAIDEGAAATESPVDTPKGYRVVHNGEIWLPLRSVRHTLPAERDAFVGRAIALRELRYRFESGARLVSLLGPGGVGKTRLAQRYGWSMLGDFPGGVWFCDLSQAQTVDGLQFALAQGLDVTLGSADPAAQLGDALVGREDCLVILDNFEQLVQQAEATVGRWLDRAPKARFLVTSRESLGVPGEAVMRLATLSDKEAGELFVLRALAASGRTQPAASDSAVLSRLVELLDGLPLAIELAAARAASMSLASLLRRIDERFALLVSKGGRRTRQATLRAAFDWSWDMLSAAEKAAFAQLSVVEGSCTLEAAEAIVEVDGEAAISLDVIQSLTDKSLVRRRDDERFDMLVSLRAYAAERLLDLPREAGDPEARTRLRHCRWFASLDAAEAGAGKGIELDNLVAACRYAVSVGNAELALGALETAWSVLDRRGPFTLAIELAERIRGLPSLDSLCRARVELVYGFALRSSGKLAQAHAALTEAVSLARSLSNRRIERRGLVRLGDLHLVRGQVEAARAILNEALLLARGADDSEVEWAAVSHLGNLAESVGDLEGAIRFYEEALDVAQRSSDRRGEGGALGNLGVVLHTLGKSAEAKARYKQALELAREAGDRAWEGNTLCNLGLLLQEQGHVEEARTALEAALEVASEMGYARLGAVVRCNLGMVLEATGLRAAAIVKYEQALSLARGLGDRRSEGQFLGYLGLAQAREGAFDRSTQSLLEGDRLLTEVADRSNRVTLLCQWTEAECLAGRSVEAGALLSLAKSMASDLRSDGDSEMGLALRDAAAAIERLDKRSSVV